MRRIRIGVIGLGFGQHHVHALTNIDEAHLVAIADNYSDKLSFFSEKYNVHTYRDGIDMLENEELDAVCICVSPRWRLPIIQKAAQLKIPMFIEKPWASNVKQAYEFEDICNNHNAVVMTGFSFRYLPAIVKLRALLDTTLGVGWVLNGEYLFDWIPQPDHWLWDVENGNGFFNENSCHLFNAICYLLGNPLSIMAEGGNFLGSPSEEAGAIVMKFESGAIAAITVGGLGTSAFKRSPRIDLITSNGQAHLTGREHIWETLSWTSRNSEIIQRFETLPESLEKMRYTYALKHFIQCVQTGETPTSGIQDGILSVAIADAVYQSARSGNKVYLNQSN